jgi:hypothetical protein
MCLVSIDLHCAVLRYYYFTFCNARLPSIATKRKHVMRKRDLIGHDMKHNMSGLQTLHDFAGNI